MSECTSFLSSLKDRGLLSKPMSGDSNMLNSFSCHNFRNVSVNNLSFSRINLLVGPNNSGKSNFIKTVTFLSDMLKAEGNTSLKSNFLSAVSRNGWEHMLCNRAGSEDTIDFSWGMTLDGVEVVYSIECCVGKNISDCRIVSERLSSLEPTDSRYREQYNYFSCHKTPGRGYFSTAMKLGKQNRRIMLDINCQESVLLQFKELLLSNKNMYNAPYVRENIAELLNGLKDYFMSYDVYSISQFNSNRMREIASIKNLDSKLAQDASNFTNLFSNYLSLDPSWRLKFVNRMQQLIPNLTDINIAVRYDHLILQLICGEHIYDLSDVSEGTLKALALNIILHPTDSNSCSSLMLDEPETNIHPAWQKVIGRWVLTSTGFKQCFISTHSPDFLDVFTDTFKRGDASIFVFGGQSDGPYKIKKIMYEDIKDDLGDWELGDLYRTSDPALGGWPW